MHMWFVVCFTNRMKEEEKGMNRIQNNDERRKQESRVQQRKHTLSNAILAISYVKPSFCHAAQAKQPPNQWLNYLQKA